MSYRIFLNNSYNLYEQIMDKDAVSSLEFRKEIIVSWQEEYLKQSTDKEDSSKTSEEVAIKEDTTLDHMEEELLEEMMRAMEEEDECDEHQMEEENETGHRLQCTDIAFDCDICSDRANDERKRTNYICANKNSKVKVDIRGHHKRGRPGYRQFRTCPECFHIHLRQKGINC